VIGAAHRMDLRAGFEQLGSDGFRLLLQVS
jgi:hypothetical protein